MSIGYLLLLQFCPRQRWVQPRLLAVGWAAAVTLFVPLDAHVCDTPHALGGMLETSWGPGPSGGRDKSPQESCPDSGPLY